MRSLFTFFRGTGVTDPTLERDFRAVYQEPRFRFMQASFGLGMIGFGVFLLMDVVNGISPAMAVVSYVRAVITLAFAVALAATVVNRAFVVRNYTAIINLFASLGMFGAALLPLAIHGHRSSADIYWSVNSSLTTAVIIIYGFARLTSRNTALIVVSGCLIGVSTVLFLPAFDWYSFGRLALHVVIVNIVAFSLRETIERRERQLFLMARENLSRNVYAQELETARAHAEEGNAVKMRFLANMGHEFRTPMNGVMQTLEIAARTAEGEMAKLVKSARSAGDSLLEMLDSILDYTRWTESTLKATLVQTSLSHALREGIESGRAMASAKGLALTLRLDLASSEDVVLIDRLMLSQIVKRLLDNAIRFTSSGSVGVSVELKKRDEAPYPAASVEIAIADTGVGIPPDLRQIVFTPFYQVDSASNRKVSGTGLGLAIVSRLVQAMGGSISLASEVGLGSTFRVRLPVEICKERVDWAVSPRSSDVYCPPSEPGVLLGRVLLVEDNEFNAVLAAELLTLMGLNVTSACDGAQAHRAATDVRFDVILMDCQMPNVDGYEATRRIRATERMLSRLAVPIIAVTANALVGDREKCLAAGMDDYLAKPYTAAQLRAKLVKWLSASGAVVVRDASLAKPTA